MCSSGSTTVLRRLSATMAALSSSAPDALPAASAVAAAAPPPPLPISAEREPVICAVARTPVGRYRGALRGYTAVELGALAAAEALRRVDVVVDPSVDPRIDEVLFGQVLQAGAGQAPARQVALACGLPDTTPCTTINKVCGSSLKCVMLAATSIRAGELQAVLCGGMESMTNAPNLIPAGADPGEQRTCSSMVIDGLTDPWTGEIMGETGEYVSRDHAISREDADAWALRSHARAHAAWESGVLGWESFPVAGMDRDGGAITLSRDEGIRPSLNEAYLAQLSPVFWTVRSAFLPVIMDARPLCILTGIDPCHASFPSELNSEARKRCNRSPSGRGASPPATPLS
jgi:acetyl-CoA acetyltransferase family protein